MYFLLVTCLSMDSSVALEEGVAETGARCLLFLSFLVSSFLFLAGVCFPYMVLAAFPLFARNARNVDVFSLHISSCFFLS